MIPASRSSPSVSAAGPGCRIRVDLISRSQPVATAGTWAKPGAGGDLGWDEFLAAPRANNDVGPGGNHVGCRNDAVLCAFAAGQLRKHLDAAGGRNQLRHPADAGNHRIVPFLEIDRRPVRQAQRALVHRVDTRGEPASQRFRLCRRATSAPSVRIMAKIPATSR